MAKRRVGSQIAYLIPDPKKSGINPIYLNAGGVRHTVGKLLTRATTLLQNRIMIRGLLAKLWGSKVAGVPFGAILGLPFGSPGREKPFGCRLRGRPQNIL
jgi:hypothetical protein